MKCPLCKGKMREGKTNLPYELGAGKIIVLTHVPALVCEQCGDEFVGIDVVRKAEKIIEKLERDGLSMGFVEYEQAA
jgi:YgiT-type zinc finger domain-containing protein